MMNPDQIQADIQDAEAAGSVDELASAYCQAGKMYFERSNLEQAMLHYQKASRLYADGGLPLKEAQVLNQLGACQVISGQPRDALATLHRALNCLPDNAQTRLEAAIQGNLGLAYGVLDDYQQAFESHKAVLERSQELGDDALRLSALINLADCRLQAGNYRSAQGFALVGYDLAQNLPSHPGNMIILDLLGMISSRLGDLHSAADYHQQAYQAARTSGDPLRQANALANLGLALEGLTEMEKAANALEKAGQIYNNLNSEHHKKVLKDLDRVRKGS